MSYFTAKTHFEHGDQPKLGILLCNLGTPQSPEPGAVRRYLAEFLSDKRVVEAPRWIWKPILHGFILRFRPRRSAAAYKKVWGQAGSPLLTISQEQTEKLRATFDDRYKGSVVVALGMRYGEPSIASALQSLRDQDARQIVVLPLYPQYASATTGSVFDAVANELKTWRWVPELRFINEYQSDPRYLDALASSIKNHWKDKGRAEHLLMSFHGIPEDYFLAGDPYFCHCQATAREVANRLNLNESEWQISFQSRVGRKQWLRPYTDHTIKALAKQGVKNLEVVCPGFSADCLETLEEIAMQNAEIFEHHGGQNLNYIASLNASSDHIDFLAALLKEHSQPWLNAIESRNLANIEEENSSGDNVKSRADKIKRELFPERFPG